MIELPVGSLSKLNNILNCAFSFKGDYTLSSNTAVFMGVKYKIFRSKWKRSGQTRIYIWKNHWKSTKIKRTGCHREHKFMAHTRKSSVAFWWLLCRLYSQFNWRITSDTKVSCYTWKSYQNYLLTHLPLEILPKMCFEASQAVFWSLSCYKELKLITKPFTGRTLRGLLIQMQNISLRSSGMRRKQNFEIVFGFKSDTAVLTFTFRFLSSLLFSLFLPHFFFLLLGI